MYMYALALFLQDQNNPINPEAARNIAMMVLALIPIIFVVAIAVVMVPCWFILKKAGFSPWLSLLCILPSLGTVVLLYIMAFSDWKVVPAPQVASYAPPVPPYPPTPPYPPAPPAPPAA